MKTAMQELLDELDLVKIVDRHNFFMVKYIIDKCLEKEKKQIIKAVEDTRGNIVPRYFLKENLSGEKYYDQTYNQNK